ncbi:MAG: FtsX-like permease family protein [Roseburia sp.]|nr:FtsX-like permease family protein [Roseburia sp.]
MKSTVWKSTFREIKQSLGRFLAILAIVALGVGFLSGLKATQPAMLQTVQKFYDNTNFYDYRLLSTVGFGKEDVAAFREKEGVEAAEGAVQFDILCDSTGGSTRVLKAHSITEEVNQLMVISGRLPESPNECVVDAELYDESWIGKKIKLSATNAEDDLEHFSYEEYVITGTVRSPLYIQFERGTTSLGNGKVSGFMFLLPEGFAEDYYTEIYVAFDHNFAMYSDEYKEYIDARQEDWETVTLAVAKDRYVTVKTDAEKELAEGKEELAEKQGEAEEELADAKKQLDDAAKQIADGEKQLADAKAEMETAPETLAKKEAELEAAEQTIKEAESQLDMGEIALGLGMAQGMGQISDALSSFQSIDLSSFGLGQSTGDSGQASSGISSDALGSLSDAEQQLSDAKQQIADGRAQIEAAKKQIEDGKAAIAEAKQQLEDGKKEIAKSELELADAKKQYEEGLKEYEEGLEEFNTQIADAKQKIADGEKALAELEEPDAYVLGRDTNVGYVCFESDSSIVDGIANVFPLFFFLVAALVCITTMNRMVEEQRTQIGVLKALGYSERTIMSKYIFYSGSAAVIGCIVGFFGGTLLFPRVIWYAYGMLYKVDSLVYIFEWKMALISLAAALACSVGTTWISCRHELTQVAAQLMRPKAPKAGKRVVLERIPFIWKRLKFLQKVSVRNILRYKKRFFMMIVGISGCSALLVTGFGVRDSIKDVATQQFTEIQTFDLSVAYSKPINEAMEQELSDIADQGVSAYTFAMETTVDLKTNKGTKDINMVVLNADMDSTPFVNFHTTGKEPIENPALGEAVISHKIADQYGIGVGDTITLRDDDMRTIQVEISGIFQNFVYNYVYISSDTYTDQLGEAPEYKTAYVNLEEDADGHLISTVIMNSADVASVSVSKDTMDRFSSMMKSLDLIVFVIILSAAGLAFIVLYNLTNINITERVREIATIKVLGFYEKETAAYVFRENNILAFLGAMVGLVLGYALHQFVMSQINVDMVTFDVHIKPISYVYSVIMTLLFAFLVNQTMKKKIDQVSMTESLKSVD